MDNTINQAPFGNIDFDQRRRGERSLTVPRLGARRQRHRPHRFRGHGVIWASAIGRAGRNATFGGKRPDVYAASLDFPGTEFHPKSLYSGFVADLDTTQLLDGDHTITVRATDNQAPRGTSAPRPIDVENDSVSLVSRTELEYPLMRRR